MIRIVTESMSDFTQEEAKAAADSLRHGGIL